VRIDHEAEEFPFQQLARVITERIASGEYPPGSRLPSMSAFAEESGLNMTTVQRAIRLLREQGTVRVVPGRGTFVPRARP
jgi:DNA-binding transcriptional regulator YhcF (GntR family)